MSKDKSNNITEQELLDYLDGKITGSEANRIERQLLDSAFDQEAFEGLSSLSSSEIKSDLTELRSRLEARKNYKQPGYLNIAATIAFLIAAFGSIWFVMENALPGNEITLNKAEDTIESQMPPVAESMEDSVMAEASSPELAIGETDNEEEQLAVLEQDQDQEIEDISSDEIAAVSDEPEEIDTINADEISSGAGQLALNDTNVEGLQTEPAAEDIADSAVEEEVENIVIETSENPVASRARETTAAPAEARAMAAAEASTSISGTVYYEEDGEPLPGVTVTLGSQQTITGPGGKFQFSGSGAGSELDFSATGIRPRKVNVEDPGNVNVVLSPQPVSNQKAVLLGYDDGTNKSPEPANGRGAFVEYVNNSLQYPEAAQNQQIEGVVLLKVTISSSGSINNIEVKKSLSASCDQEAIRLIREGPQWSPAQYNGEAVEGSVRVRIIFDL